MEMRDILNSGYQQYRAGGGTLPGYEWMMLPDNDTYWIDKNPSAIRRMATSYGPQLDQLYGQTNRPQPTATAPIAPAPTQSSPMSALDKYIGDLASSGGDVDSMRLASEARRDQSMAAYMDTMKRLMDREESMGTGNPFIDMLQAYNSFRKRKNPNYQNNGLIGLATGLFNKNKNGV